MDMRETVESELAAGLYTEDLSFIGESVEIAVDCSESDA
jgi:hypothetical protein